MTGPPAATPPVQWLMQPRWLPALRASIGVAIALVGVIGIVVAWPADPLVLTALVLWVALGIFLVWASRRERSGTLLEDDAIAVTAGRETRRLTRTDILDLRHDEPERPGRVQALLRDGEIVTLLGVPPTELEHLRTWHVGPPRR